MRAHYLQHVPFEGLGSMESWLLGAGYQISCTRLFADEPLPEIRNIDLLIILGGPMSVNDDQRFPWLSAEKNFIREAIDAGVSTLGICLGAQLIASSAGARVYPNVAAEIGWFPIASKTDHRDESFQVPESVEVFHWHGETFELPPGAKLLASSAGCENQAFQIGAKVIGLQFHLETTPESAAALCQHCADELIPGEFVQSADEILDADATRYETVNQLMAQLLAYLCESS